MIKRVKLPEATIERDARIRSKRQIVAWLANRRGLFADAGVIGALVKCSTLPALEFTASLLSVRGWRQVEPTAFENHAYRLEIEPECGGHRVNLLFSSRLRHETVAFDIVSETPTENLQRSNDPRAAAVQSSVSRYVRLTVGNMPKALRWLKTTLRKEQLRRVEAELPPSLLGRVDREDLDWRSVPPPVRQTRLEFWLEAHRIEVDEKYSPVLAQCETTAEMRFLIPMVQQIPWEILERNCLRYQRIELKIHWPVENAHFDFLIQHRTSRLFKPVVVEIERPALQRDSTTFGYVRCAADSAGFPVEVLPSSEAAARGNWWARLILEAAANDRFQNRELRDLQP